MYTNPIPEVTLKYKSSDVIKSKIHTSTDAYECLKQMYDSDTLEYTECFIVIYLNRACNSLGWHKLSSGGTSGTIVDVKVLMATALKINAHFLILSHNHPSGNLQPSEADKAMTKKVVSAGEILDVKIIDHLIITSDGFWSFADNGAL